jgi:hypothetical protein
MEEGGHRPAVDVVVPFAGPPEELTDLLARLEPLARALGDGDTLTVVDNRPSGAPEVATPGGRVVRAPERQSSYFARNRGARTGSNPWLLFIDADVDPPAGLVDSYFRSAPGERVGVLAGGVIDEPLDPAEGQTIAARYAMLRNSMSQEHTLLDGQWSYAQTANCAVRRDGFEAVGGFRDYVRSGGDADLCFRLRSAGWAIEARPEAAVVHRSRRRLRKLLRQRARHGSGAAWLAGEYPGAFPRARWLGLTKWTVQSFGEAAVARVRGRRDDAVVAAMEPLLKWAFELGRLVPNRVDGR